MNALAGHPTCTTAAFADKIEKILNTKIPNCKFWDLVQARAKELYQQDIEVRR